VSRKFNKMDDGDPEVLPKFACEACGGAMYPEYDKGSMVMNIGFQIGWKVRKQPKAQSRTRGDMGMGWKSVSVRL
jgi:hypothetical protein